MDDQHIITTVSLDPDVLLAVDTYRSELRRSGTVTTRSALVNAALLEYLQNRREEAARAEENLGGAIRSGIHAALPQAHTVEQRRGLVELGKEHTDA